MRLPILAAAGLIACGGDASRPFDAAARADAAPAPVDATPSPGRRWIAGDLHMHVAPPDDPGDVALSVAEIAQRAAAAGVEFVILTPHLGESTWRRATSRRRWLDGWRALAAEARATAGMTLIPGVEYTIRGVGHVGISGVDLAVLDGGDLPAAAHRAGALVIVNHPFAVPTKIPGIRVSHRDLSFRPWTGSGQAPHLDGVEVWNLPLGLANLVSRPGGQTGEARAFAAADRLARAERRPIAVVGGTDNHHGNVMATTWVLARDGGEPAILAALRAGATCVGGVDAGALTARGDRDPPGRWATIGERVDAAARVTLRWPGRARLFVDGVDQGEHDGGWLHDGAAGVHTYRIVIGASRCGFVYANL